MASRRRRRTRSRAERRAYGVPRPRKSGRGEPKVYDPKSGRWVRDESRRPRQWKGASVNEDLSPSRPPGRWVDADECSVCGERYRDFRSGVSWEEGVQLVRDSNPEKGGGFRSRGPVLYAMHVLKLDAWYRRHMECGEWKRERLPPPIVWALRFGDAPARAAALEVVNPEQLDDEFPF
jgi:hypothetical protein